ncbi:MAG: hypothetical protein B7Z51_03650 [Methyloversatilis sp. 12-65-5]|nr:MAG: hypothetical protein B7Z51_03650 [Methyloversatilis sp. 12-65-5]
MPPPAVFSAASAAASRCAMAASSALSASAWARPLAAASSCAVTPAISPASCFRRRATTSSITASQARYSPHFNSINKRLLRQGIRTYSQQEITAHIAQAEVDAYFRNDPDAALAASKKMGARLVLRGTIASRSMLNPVVRIPEVYVTIAFALMKPDGTLLSDAQASAESYSGSDTLAMAGRLVEEKADGLVNMLANAASSGDKKRK